jgi:transposase
MLRTVGSTKIVFYSKLSIFSEKMIIKSVRLSTRVMWMGGCLTNAEFKKIANNPQL